MKTFIAVVVLTTLALSQDAHVTVELFQPGTISTGDAESHLSFTPDGKTVYFIKSAPAFNYWTIVESHLKGGRWSTPIVASFSGQYADADPFVTADNKQIWFISNRPDQPGDTAKEDMDVWYVKRTPKGWSEPHHPGAPINSTADEWYPSISDAGTLAFGSDRPGGQGATDIYFCKLVDSACSSVENAGTGINSAEDEFEPLLAPDESWLIFMSNRKNGIGRSDLYLSRKVNGTWTAAEVLVAPISSPAFEYSPRLSADRKFLFFSSNRSAIAHKGFDHPLSYRELTNRLRSPGNGLLDIYFVDLNTALAGAERSEQKTQPKPHN